MVEPIKFREAIMKRFFRSFTLTAVAVMSIVACNKDVIDEPTFEQPSGTTLTASISSATQTKVSFTDNTTSIDLAWESGDSFTLYDESGYYAGTFTTANGDGNFTSADIESLSDDIFYTAIYPASSASTLAEAQATDLTSTQDGDKIGNLSNSCYMQGELAAGTTSISFDHQMAIMTFKFTSDERPAKLIFENGDETYTVTYSEINADEDTKLYTSHIMVNPCASTTRTLTFSLYNSADVAYDIRTVETSKAYEAGMRYTASVSDLENSVWSGTGTYDDPYQIENATQLRALATNVNNGKSYSGEYFLMTTDINLYNEAFTPIGTNSSFYGTFNGGGYEVSGLYVPASYDMCVGLFGYNIGTIANLGVSGSVASYAEAVGGIVGCNHENGIITNCYNSCSVSGEMEIGGIAGVNSGTITNCYNSGSVDGTFITGGIAGFNSGTITNCYNSGSVSGDINSGAVVGDASGAITNCYYLSGSFSSTFGEPDSSASATIEKDATNMQSDEFVTLLNNNAYTYNSENSSAIQACAWVAVSGGYPTFNFSGTPTAPNNIVFEDENFKNALLSSSYNPDTNGDNEISYDEASAMTYMSVEGNNISSMAEIKYFTNLVYINCWDNNLTELDLSNNTQLTTLECYMNSLTELDLSNNTQLRDLDCSNNNLSTLDVSKCPSVWEMWTMDRQYEQICNLIMNNSFEFTLYVSFEQWMLGLNQENLSISYMEMGMGGMLMVSVLN